MYDGVTGTVIGQPTKYTFAEELQRNISVQTSLNKQLAIVNECELKLFTRSSGKDKESTNKTALSLYDILQNPKCRPAPQNWYDIVEYIFTEYTYHGIAGLVLVYEGEILPQNIRYLLPATNIQYQNNIGKDYYSVSLEYNSYHQTYQFTFDEEMGFYKIETQNQKMILIPFGKYDFCLRSFISPFEVVRESILIQNYVLTSAKSFYENSCRPSAIITIEYKDDNENAIFTKDNEEAIQKVISNFKKEIQGTINTGKAVILNQPNMKVNITPISIPTNAGDCEKMLQITKNNIYSFIAGGSLTVIEGQNEYSNNAVEKLREFYNGTLSYANQVIINSLNSFLRTYLTEFDAGAIDRKDTYFILDKSGAEFYKRHIEIQASEAYKNNEIGILDLYNIKKELREIWSGVEMPSDNLLLAEIQKSNRIE